MAWFTMAKVDTVDFWCSADPDVQPHDEHEEPTMLAESQIKSKKKSATRYSVRPLTWVESQRFDGLTPAETIDGVVGLGLVAIDGDEQAAEQAKKALHPQVAVPLCVCVQAVTWGAFTSAGND